MIGMARPGRFLWRWAFCLAALLGIAGGQAPVVGADGQKAESFDALANEFKSATRPVIQQFCLRCHSSEEQEGDLDLERFKALEDIRHDTKVWQKVAEMLDHREMPPKSAQQPPQKERDQLRGWVERYLRTEALAHAGDPGPVVLRRLNNAQYTYTLRDLTGIGSLAPAREFPVDGAAGEGFTNTGNALAMSPAFLAKYLAAAKEVAAHAVLLPDGFRFSPSTTRRDWTNEILDRIREFYREFSDARGSETVNLQGVVFNTNDGGRLPLDKYLAATIAERQALEKGSRTIDSVARERNLNAKYLGLLWKSLCDPDASLLIGGIRERWHNAKPADLAALVAAISEWQATLWRFRTVGQLGKVGGPKRWLEPVDPLVSAQELRFKFPDSMDQSEVEVSLVASDGGDGNAHDCVIWQQPRLVAPGRPDLLLREVRAVTRELATRRHEVFAHTASYLMAADEAAVKPGQADLAKLAAAHAIDRDALVKWLDYLGIGSGDAVQIRSYLPKKITNGSNYPFINGWGNPDLPQLLANSSDQHVRIPGNMNPHSVAVHPTPTLRVAAGWRSPLSATFRVEGSATHAHPECGNGVTWSLELRRGPVRRRLAAGIAHGGTPVKIGPIDQLDVHAGDLLSLLIGPRDGNHACDLTMIELKLTSTGAESKTWSLIDDVLERRPRRQSSQGPERQRSGVALLLRAR